MSNLYYGAERPEYIGRRIDTDEQATILLDRVTAYLVEGNTHLARRSLDRAYDLLVTQADKASATSIIRTLTLSGQLCETHDAALIFYKGARTVITANGLRRPARRRRSAEITELLRQHEEAMSVTRLYIARRRADKVLDKLLAGSTTAS